MAIPIPVLTAIPIPFAILLLLLACYHLTPLLQLVPHLTPRLSKLANLIPHPGRRNLPREFFNLPPRPEDGDDETRLSAAGCLEVRGKLMLFLIAHTGLSLAAGWGYLFDMGTGRGAGAMLALSIIPLPASILTLATFTSLTYQSNERYHSSDSLFRSKILAGGGVTHDTLYPRILPISLIPTILITIVTLVLPASADLAVLGFSGFLVGSLLGMSLVGRYRARQQLRTGAIRLRSSSPGLISGEGSAVQELREKDIDDWVSSPGHGSCRIPEFSYSPSVATPRSHPRARSRNPDGSPTSWISSPTATPATIPEWKWSPGDTIATPGSAITRERSRSPSPSLPIEEMPDVAPRTAKSSATTMYTMSLSTPGSGLRSIGGSVMGEYSPDPFQPMPRNFQSLSSYPISPSQLATPDHYPTRSRTTLISNALRSADTLAFVPEERTNSTFTLNTHPSASDFVTPDRRRAPPPPPMPMDMPLPPTPTFARSETLFDWPHKASTEMLMGERDWVAVSEEGTEAGWGRDGQGVGVVALLSTLVTFGLYSPLLILGVSDVTLSLYLISILLSTALLALTSHLLRYRPAKRLNKGSTRSVSTHQSLALLSESQLSLPITVSPKLTPPAEKRTTMMNDTLVRLLGPKPSVSDFGYDRRQRPHTVYANAQRDAQAEQKLKHVMARRSTDLWLEQGHAIEGGGLISRVTEMLKPYPAMRVLDTLPERPDTLTRLRGGVMSMIAKRKSHYDEEHSMANMGAPSISITSPSKYDKRRVSGISSAEGGDYDYDQTMGSAELSAEIQVAQYGRMSRGPTVLCGPGHERADSYDVDWLGSQILPGLVPGLVIGPNVRIGPRPSSMGAAPVQNQASFASTSRHTRGSSSSIDWTPTSNTSGQPATPSIRQRLRHKASFSLPNISPADFTDVRSSMYECGREEGVDLPLIPSNLSPVYEESDRSLGSLALGVLHADRIGMDSTISEDEAMAQEMEQVMAMDTPTRAEFVISPPLSSYVSHSGRLSSRASNRSGLSYISHEEAPPVPDMTRYSLDESHPLVSSANVNFSRPRRLQPQTSMPTMSHPHPPPLQHQTSYPSIAAVTNDLKRSSVVAAHPPLNARTLNNKKSNETMHSQMTSFTDDSHGRYNDAEEFRPSRQELTLVKQLKERAQSAQGHSEGAKPQLVKGLKPLQLVSDKNVNRMSLPVQSHKVSVLPDKRGQMGRITQLQKGSNGTKGSKRSMGSDKENVSVRKGSATSGTSFVKKTMGMGREDRTVQKGSGTNAGLRA